MVNVNELRRRVKEQHTFADSVEAFFHLLEQPELTWHDLLDGLDHPGLIAENAMIHLHRILNIPVPPTGFISDHNIWVNILKDKGISEDQQVEEIKEEKEDR